MIYDCFTFFNELDLLEIRLNELNEVVDYFVLVEATYTHQNKPKPLYFEDNKERFKAFSHKIIHVKIDEKPDRFIDNENLFWSLEKYQRMGISLGLTQSNESDIIMISDIDEIPKREKVIEATNHLKSNDAVLFMLDYYLYFINTIEKTNHNIFTKYRYFVLSYLGYRKYFTKSINFLGWPGTVMIQKNKFENAQITREIWKSNTNYASKNISVKPILKSGWHFSFLGGTDAIIKKLESFAHNEFNTNEFKDPIRIEKLLLSNKTILENNSTIVKVNDNELPKYVVENKTKFQKLFL